MKLHPWSFVFGLVTAGLAVAVRGRVRPVIVEIAALGGHLGRAGWAIFERKVESFEDMRAEVSERMRQRAANASWTKNAVQAPAASGSYKNGSSGPHRPAEA